MVVTTIDEALCARLCRDLGLKLARARSLRGSAQRVCLMNLTGSPRDRVAAIMAQPEWAGEKESKAISGFHNWFPDNGYLPKDTPLHPTQRGGAARASREDPRLAAYAILPAELVLSRINNFWGYGALSAPVWFVGMEESIPSTITIDSELLKARFEAADGKQTIDLRDDMQGVADHIQ